MVTIVVQQLKRKSNRPTECEIQKDTEKKTSGKYRKGNLIKNDLRIRAEVQNDSVSSKILYAYMFILHTSCRRFFAPNEGNHHAGKRDTRGYRQLRSYHM